MFKNPFQKSAGRHKEDQARESDVSRVKLAEFVSSASPSTRFGVVTNITSNVPVPLLVNLCFDRYPVIRRAALAHPALPLNEAETITMRHLQLPPADIVNDAPHLLSSLVKAPDRDMRAFPAMFLSDSPDSLAQLAADDSGFVRACVASNPAATADHLRHLARDQIVAVRAEVAGHTNTDTLTLLSLMRDRDDGVAFQAQETLSTRIVTQPITSEETQAIRNSGHQELVQLLEEQVRRNSRATGAVTEAANNTIAEANPPIQALDQSMAGDHDNDVELLINETSAGKPVMAEFDEALDDLEMFELDVDTEWELNIRQFGNDILSMANNQTPGSREWGVSRAVELMLRCMHRKVKSHCLESQFTLAEWVAQEMVMREELAAYEPFLQLEADGNTVQHGLMLISLFDGLDSIRTNVLNDTAWGQQASVQLQEQYQTMLRDYQKLAEQHKISAPFSLRGGAMQQGIDASALSTLIGRYQALVTRQPNSHARIANHVLTYVFAERLETTQLTEADRINMAVKFSDPGNGLHATHRTGFQRGLDDVRLELPVNLDKTILETLKLALRPTETVQELERELKRLSLMMGWVDGYSFAFRERKFKGKAVENAWNATGRNAGRSTGGEDGPDLLKYLSSSEARQTARKNLETEP